MSLFVCSSSTLSLFVNKARQLPTTSTGIVVDPPANIPTMAAAMITDDMKKRDRKVNFTDEELRRLLACYKEHASVLVSKFDSVITQKLKNGLWATIASQVSATGVAIRSTIEVKKKWSDIKRAALKHASETKYPKTGGGPPVHKPWFVDAVLDILGDETSLIEGIQGA